MSEHAAPADSRLHEWVHRAFGDDACPLKDLTVQGGDFESLLLCRGPGCEPGPFSEAVFSSSRFMVHEDGELTWGTAPNEGGTHEELGLRLTDGRIVWMPRHHGMKPAPSLPRVPLPTARNSTPPGEDSEVERRRQERIERHPRMRLHIVSLAARHTVSQAALARKIKLSPQLLAEYNSGFQFLLAPHPQRHLGSRSHICEVRWSVLDIARTTSML